MMFLINEQNVSVVYIDINAVSLCLDLNIFQQDECFCSKLGLEVEYAKSNVKISLSQIWMICQLPCARRINSDVKSVKSARPSCTLCV